MTSYVLPQASIEQRAASVTAGTTGEAYAAVVGPDYLKHTEISAGAYAGAELGIAWPEHVTGGVVDLDSVVVSAKNAWLKYFEASDATVTTLAYNTLLSSTSVFKTANGVNRSAGLYRDVAVGDGVLVTGTDANGDAVSLKTFVQSLSAVYGSAAIGAISASADNAATGVGSAAAVQSSGTENDVTVTANGAAYDGIASGKVSETYTVTVTQGGLPAAARLKVVSASGTDNQSSVTPAAFGSATSIGTRGLVVTFDTDGEGTGTPASQFIAGQAWTVTVAQAYTAPTAEAAGSFNGPSSFSYVVRVSRGGDLSSATVSERPQISVISTTGVDAGGPYTLASGVAASIGAYGVTFELTGTNVAAGSVWYIPVTAAAAGAVQKIVLANSLPALMAGRSVTYSIHLVGDVAIPQYTGNTKNFGLVLSGVNLAAGLGLYSASWADSDGVQEALPLVAGDLYFTYRELRQSFTEDGLFYSSDLPETPSPDSGLFYGVLSALKNSGGMPVIAVAVPTDDADGYAAALARLELRNDVQSVVILSHAKSVRDLASTHAISMSSKTYNLFRRALFTSDLDATVTVSSDLQVEILDNPDLVGTQYTRFYVAGGSLLSSGVTAGDKLLLGLSTDSETGVETYETFTIDSVVSEEYGYLTADRGSGTTAVASRIVRELDADGMATAFGAKSAGYGDWHVSHAYPPKAVVDGDEVDGAYLLCAFAGLRSRSLPHQPLTNAEIVGFDSLPMVTNLMTRAALNKMAENGTMIFAQEPDGGAIYVRHALTTADYSDIQQREESVISNFDDLCRVTHGIIKGYSGKYNNTSVARTEIDEKLAALLSKWTTASSTQAGPRIESGTFGAATQDETLQDNVTVDASWKLPRVLNVLRATITAE